MCFNPVTQRRLRLEEVAHRQHECRHELLQEHRPGRLIEPHGLILSGVTGHALEVASVSFPRRPGRVRALFVLKRLEVHAAHSAHTSTGTSRNRWALLLRQLGNHRLGGNQQTRDGGRVLQRGRAWKSDLMMPSPLPRRSTVFDRIAFDLPPAGTEHQNIELAGISQEVTERFTARSVVARTGNSPLCVRFAPIAIELMSRS
jgi:hypothetical protein